MDAVFSCVRADGVVKALFQMPVQQTTARFVVVEPMPKFLHGTEVACCRCGCFGGWHAEREEDVEASNDHGKNSLSKDLTMLETKLLIKLVEAGDFVEPTAVRSSWTETGQTGSFGQTLALVRGCKATPACSLP